MLHSDRTPPPPPPHCRTKIVSVTINLPFLPYYLSVI